MPRIYDMSLAEGRRMFLDDYWLHLADFAYRQYLENGRGAVIISGSNMDENEMLYISLGQLAAYPDIAKAVQDYDPEAQIVVIIALPGILALQTYKGEPPPQNVVRVMERSRKKSTKQKTFI